MEGKGRSRRRSPHQQWKRRLSSVLAIVLTAVMVLNMPLSIDGLGLHVSNAFASASNADRKDSVWATASNAKYKQGESQDVDIYVIADDNGAVPGNTSSMTLYLKNNTNQMITEGVLTFKGSHIQKEDGVFQDIGAGDEASQVIVSGPGQDSGTMPESGAAADDGAAANDGALPAADVSGNDAAQGTGLVQDTVTSGEGLLYEESFDADEADEDSDFAEDFEGDEEDSEEEETWKLTGIDLQPGEMHEVSFAFYTDEDVKSTKAHVKFSFAGEDEEGERVSSNTQFYYSIGLPHVNISLEDGMQIESNVNNDMEIWMTEPDWVDEDLEERIEDQEEKEAEKEQEEDADNSGSYDTASDSNASKSDADRADTASDSQADREEKPSVIRDEEKIDKYTDEAMTISESRVSYTVEIFGAEYDLHARKADEVEDIGWISCVYKIAKETQPGIYYGKVTAAGRWNNKKFTSEQGFLFEVTGEWDGNYTAKSENVTVHAHAEDGVLPKNVTLKVTELEEGGAEYNKAKEAMDGTDIQFEGMKALDIRFENQNGEEVEPEGEVQISIEMKEGALPADAAWDTVEVHHLKEVDDETIEVETVADAAGLTDGTVKSGEAVQAELDEIAADAEEGTEASADVYTQAAIPAAAAAPVTLDAVAEVDKDTVAVAEFSVESFSTFSITWDRGNFELTVHLGLINESGTWQYITETEETDISVEQNGKSFTLSQIAPEISGYSYSETRLGGLSGDVVTGLSFERSWNWGERDYVLTFYKENGGSTSYTSGNGGTPKGYSLFMVYTPVSVSASLTIQDHIIEDGEITAVPISGIQDQISTYKWYRSQDGSSFTEVELVRYENGTANMSGEKQENINVALDSWQNRDAEAERERFYYKVEALDDKGEVIARSDSFQVPYYMKPENGSFEEPVNPNSAPGSDYSITGSEWANQWSNEVYAAKGGVWQTTGEGSGVKEGQDIEIVSIYDESNIENYKWYGTFQAKEGEQFAELNCERDGALYQDVLTIKGQKLNYWLSHRARGANRNNDPEYDTMYVVIMPTALALTGGNDGGPVDTQSEVLQYINSNHEGVYYKSYTSDDQSWHDYVKIQEYTAASYLTRFFFVAVDTAVKDGNKTQGNFLDQVGFGTQLPDVDPGNGRLFVTKIVKGLTAEEMANYQIQLSGIPNSNVTLSNFTESNNGYTCSFMSENIKTGTSCSISEVVPEELANALEKANIGPEVTITVDGQTVETADVTIADGRTHEIVFTNTYQKKAVDIKVSKKVEGNMSSLNDSFEFVLSLIKDGSNYTDAISAVVRTTGTDTGKVDTYSYDEKKGGYVFTLKPQQEIVFSAPYGSTWTVRETDNSGYTDVKYLFDGRTVAGQYEVVGSEPLTTAVNITFTNIKNVNTPTGFTSTYYPYLVMLAIAVAGTASFIYPTCRRRRHKGDR